MTDITGTDRADGPAGPAGDRRYVDVVDWVLNGPFRQSHLARHFKRLVGVTLAAFRSDDRE